MLAAAFLGSAVVAAPAIAAAATDSTPAWEDPAIASRRIDAAFWEARDEMRYVDDLWELDFQNYPGRSMPDDRLDAWGERYREAERKMMMAKITTVAALWAKLDAIKTGEMDAHHGDEDYPSPIDLVLWDIERMMKAEYRV
ncbi:hypothetical protein EBF16_27365 [Sphingobium yanoikuyae]|uniref:DUF885 domain-containing protein n=2 Tax=Sphingobium yanoikuyae TaxID=13690 RepID=A0A3G2UZI1_SPHYA|nr:hypothetical protein EBF16_27365 [Sphingobium yanoikuyae]